MRPLEILLTIANVLSFCGVLIPRLARIRRVHYAVFLALVIAAIQVLVEGSRWQMVPAYILAISLSTASALRIILPAKKQISQNFAKRLVTAGCISVGIPLCMVSLVLPILLPVYHLRTPSGPYQIGTVTYHWTDSSRREIFSKNPADRRQLLAQVWYPVKGDLSPARAPYVDDAAAMSAGLTHALSSSGLLKLPSFFFDYFKYVRTHAIPYAPVATDKVSFPVLIYVTGLDGFRQASMFQVESLVSHGYIVVGLDQPYTAAAVAFPNGQVIEGLSRAQVQPLIDQSISPAADAPGLNGQPLTSGIVPYLAQDVIFTLNKLVVLNSSDPKGILTGHLDLARVGVFGVSLGAMVAAEACHEDLRLSACLMMDAAMPADVVKAGLKQPGMWLTRPASDMRLERARSGGWSEKAIRQTLSTMQTVYAEAKPGTSYYVSVSGMFHVNFTDAPYWFPFGSQLGLTGPIDGQRGFDIVNAYSLAFFDRFLKDKKSPLLAGLSEKYPEVNISTH
jgi:predicted dienelactone hydrolase